jgi:hypothetical protein
MNGGVCKNQTSENGLPEREWVDVAQFKQREGRA